MKTTVYLMRHAEAEGNVYRRCHGQYDSLLTPRAYKQLPYLAKRFENVHLDAVYSSDLFRARKTAEAVAKPHGVGVRTFKTLREIDMGDWEDLTWAELSKFWPGQFALWKTRPWESHPPHGEAPLEAGLRMLNGVREIVRLNPGKTIAVAAHGSVIRCALTLAHGWRPEQLGEQGWGDNTCVSRLDFNGTDNIDVVYENDASHLPAELSTFAAVGWKNKTSMPENLQLWFRRADPLNKDDAERIKGYMESMGSYTDNLIPNMIDALKISPRAVAFGCLEGTEEPVSLVYLKPQDDSIADAGIIDGFFIADAYRNKGLGQQLLGHAVSVYRRLGKHFLLAKIHKGADSALNFFFNAGFEQPANGSNLFMSKKINIDP